MTNSFSSLSNRLLAEVHDLIIYLDDQADNVDKDYSHYQLILPRFLKHIIRYGSTFRSYDTSNNLSPAAIVVPGLDRQAGSLNPCKRIPYIYIYRSHHIVPNHLDNFAFPCHFIPEVLLFNYQLIAIQAQRLRCVVYEIMQKQCTPFAAHRYIQCQVAT